MCGKARARAGAHAPRPLGPGGPLCRAGFGLNRSGGPPPPQMHTHTKILAKSIHPYYLFTFSLIIFLAFLLGVTASMPTGAGAA